VVLQDLLAGVVLALVLMAVTTPFVELLDCLLIAHPWCFPGLNLLGLGLCLAYPDLKEWSTARGDTTQVISVFSGIYQGMWYMGQVTSMEMAEEAAASALTGWQGILGAALFRLVLGMVVCVTLLQVGKKLVVYVAATFCGLDPSDPKTKQYFPVELTYKYISYFVPSFACGYFMPLIYQLVGLHRAGYLLEIHRHSHHFGL
jgi:hypothetical protein